MNVAVKTLNRSVFIPVILSWPISIGYQLAMWCLMLMVLFSAFGLVYIKDIDRQLTGEYQILQRNYQTLHTKWSQLLLEDGVWSSRTRVEKIAKKQLGMVVPAKNSIILVKNG